MKSYAVHYLNKYPGSRVEFTETKLSVFSAVGLLLVAIILGGNGAIQDVGDELGAQDKHDLGPIPRNTRVHKLHATGKMGLDEEAAVRRQQAQALAVDGKILSIEEYKKLGHSVDRDGNVAPLETKTDSPQVTIAQA